MIKYHSELEWVMKTCFKCLCVKALNEFYVHKAMADGHLNKCKECTKKDSNERRYGPRREYVLEYDRQRGSLENRLAANRKRQATVGRIAHIEANKRYMAAHPDRAKAKNTVSNAVRNGKLEKWPTCAVPDCINKPEAHHPDYSRPLDVVWLCDWHHKQAHKIKDDK